MFHLSQEPKIIGKRELNIWQEKNPKDFHPKHER
jgi:hypothetical protein